MKETLTAIGLLTASAGMASADTGLHLHPHGMETLFAFAAGGAAVAFAALVLRARKKIKK